MKSNCYLKLNNDSPDKLHVALIMDGNGRWAEQRRLSRHQGHRTGVETVRRIVKAAPDLGIDMLTLYAFSSDNWKRPAAEVSLLMGLLRRYLRSDVSSFVENDVRLIALGRRDRLPADLVSEIAQAERQTAKGKRLTVRVALDYSARDQLIAAVRELDDPNRDSISKHLSGTGTVCDVDLLIRTSGEQRLSDFLLWECAYAELYFTERHWPEFNIDDLKFVLEAYAVRSRRFGGLPAAKKSAVANDITWRHG